MAEPDQRVTWQILGAVFGRQSVAGFASVTVSPRLQPQTAVPMLRAGLRGPPSRWLKSDFRQFPQIPVELMPTARSELLLHERRYDEAIEVMSDALATSQFTTFHQVLGAQTLARALVARGRVDEAIALLEKATAAPRTCGNLFQQAIWPHARHELMQLYRRRNRDKEAQAIQKELSNITSLADAEFVMNGGYVVPGPS